MAVNFDMFERYKQKGLDARRAGAVGFCAGLFAGGGSCDGGFGAAGTNA